MAGKSKEDKKEAVLFSRQGHVGVITLNRPEAMNSLNGPLCSRLSEILEVIERDDDIHAAIITGTGEKAFCAGIDLRERHGMSEGDVNALRRFVIFQNRSYSACVTSFLSM